MAECAACGGAVNEEVERTTRRLLSNLDEERHTKLAATYQGEAPDVLCPDCFLPTVGMLNGVSR